MSNVMLSALSIFSVCREESWCKRIERNVWGQWTQCNRAFGAVYGTATAARGRERSEMCAKWLKNGGSDGTKARESSKKAGSLDFLRTKIVPTDSLISPTAPTFV